MSELLLPHWEALDPDRERHAAKAVTEAPFEEPSWQTELDARYPRRRGTNGPGRMPSAGRYSWLKLQWEPGQEWAPICRWVIYRMIPKEWAPRAMIEFLEMAPPEVIYDPFAPTPEGQVIHKGPPVTLHQHALFQEWGCYADPYWIVQGNRGGHPVRFHDNERRMMKMQGRESEPPAPGDLPYSTPNRLTWAGLERLDHRRMTRFRLDQLSKPKNMMVRNRKAELKRLRTEYLDSLWDEMDAMADMVASSIGSGFHDTPQSPRNLDELVERARNDYIEGTDG